MGLMIGILYARIKGLPSAPPEEIWSIHAFKTLSPFDLSAVTKCKTPIMDASKVKDTMAYFVADPFMLFDGGQWFMFFEIFEAVTRKGCIGLAKSSNGLEWCYDRVVLREDFHISYPHVFKAGGQFFMVVESSAINGIRLYQAKNYPYEWVLIKTIIEGDGFVDPSVIYAQSKWWLFTSVRGEDNLLIYYSDELLGDWKQHSANPIRKDSSNPARLAGRIIRFENNLYRPAQLPKPYGSGVMLNQIVELTENKFKEKLVMQKPILKSGAESWCASGMHHCDMHMRENEWIVCSDGHRKLNKWERQMLWLKTMARKLVHEII